MNKVMNMKNLKRKFLAWLLTVLFCFFLFGGQTFAKEKQLRKQSISYVAVEKSKDVANEYEDAKSHLISIETANVKHQKETHKSNFQKLQESVQVCSKGENGKIATCTLSRQLRYIREELGRLACVESGAAKVIYKKDCPKQAKILAKKERPLEFLDRKIEN